MDISKGNDTSARTAKFPELLTRANSIDRALDQVGDKWSMLTIQGVFWGNHTFTQLLKETGASRGVMTDRLNWLISIGCLKKQIPKNGGKRAQYHLTRKSVDLYITALLALEWEREFFPSGDLDGLVLEHVPCGAVFRPSIRCDHCNEEIQGSSVYYKEGPGAKQDVRSKKVRRRSTVSIDKASTSQTLYKNLINTIGDRWTANVISLAFLGLKRFEEIHQALPIATNILSDRLRILTREGILEQRPYQHQPLRCAYHLTTKGKALFGYFLALKQWGDTWCDQGMGEPVELYHKTCGHRLGAVVVCDQCREPLSCNEVQYHFRGSHHQHINPTVTDHPTGIAKY